MKCFLEQGGFYVFIIIFEDLYGLKQFLGLVVQCLMQQGYGFVGEGDWKIVVLFCIMKVMLIGLQGGIFFMEDYIYYFEKGNDLVFGFYMLEVCLLIVVEEKLIFDVQYFGIGGKDDFV